MIFQRALQRELASAAGASFTVLFSISVTWTLITILGKAAGGKVASEDVIALLAFAALNYLPTVLILTSFISVLMVVTRTYRDSEMVVWFASGLSLTRWIRPVLTFGMPIVLLTALLAFYATPWAKQKSIEYTDRFQKREDLQQVSPGQFRESASSNRIFFVEGVSGQTAVVHNVFVNTVDEKGTAIVVAKEGSITEAPDGTRFLELKNGRRYQGTPGSPEFQTMEFEKYSMRVASQEAVSGTAQKVEAMPSSELFKAPGPLARAEVLWRLSIPIMCVLLLLLAIPLGFVNPRAGSSANLIVALLVFFTYQNLVKVFEGNVKQGKYMFSMAWWPLHVLILLVVIGLFAWRANVNNRYHPRAMWARFKNGGAQARTKGGAK